MASETVGKDMWERCADADGWISKTAFEVITEVGIQDYNVARDAEESLLLALAVLDVEYEDSITRRWKFIK